MGAAGGLRRHGIDGAVGTAVIDGTDGAGPLVWLRSCAFACLVVAAASALHSCAWGTAPGDVGLGALVVVLAVVHRCAVTRAPRRGPLLAAAAVAAEVVVHSVLGPDPLVAARLAADGAGPVLQVVQVPTAPVLPGGVDAHLAPGPVLAVAQVLVAAALVALLLGLDRALAPCARHLGRAASLVLARFAALVARLAVLLDPVVQPCTATPRATPVTAHVPPPPWPCRHPVVARRGPPPTV